MARRLQLHDLLKDILGSDRVYYQPPENVKLEYPCIVYNLSDIRLRHGNNLPYIMNDLYLVTLIHRRPDNDIYRKIASLPRCSLSRTFVNDNLNHYAFDLYF